MKQIFFSFLCFILITGFLISHGFCEGVPTVGSVFPEVLFKSPESAEDKTYLGIGSSETFSIKNLDCQLVVLEVIGVYCPKCHVQHPLFNKLFHRIKKDAELSKKVKMFSLAAGANSTETGFVRKDYMIPYPIITDPKFESHKSIGEPKTPFTMLITKQGKVVYTNLGVIGDTDIFLQEIKKLSQ